MQVIVLKVVFGMQRGNCGIGGGARVQARHARGNGITLTLACILSFPPRHSLIITRISNTRDDSPTQKIMNTRKLLCLAVLALPLQLNAQGADPALAAAAKEAGARVTNSGLVIRMLTEGKGAQPNETSTVNVHYRGTFPDGREFDSSYKRGQPIEFPLNRVIKCWTEGVALMKVGSKAKLTCPSHIAYGERGAGGTIPPNATLVFEVELLGVR
jgi:FKBP-type peptidyl-prolyl cis-trans isomerase FkpA